MHAACLSKKSGSGVASKNSTVENGHVSSDGEFLLVVLNVKSSHAYSFSCRHTYQQGWTRAKPQGTKIVCVV